MSSNNVVIIVTGLIGLGIQALNTQEWIEFSWRNNAENSKFSVDKGLEHGSWRNHVYNVKFSVKTRVEHGLAIEYTNFQ